MTSLFPGLGQIEPLQLVGLLGFCCYVTSYCCLSFGILTSEHLRYYILNTMAALLVLTSLSHEFNLASAMIQGFWITIGSFCDWSASGAAKPGASGRWRHGSAAPAPPGTSGAAALAAWG